MRNFIAYIVFMLKKANNACNVLTVISLKKTPEYSRLVKINVPEYKMDSDSIRVSGWDKMQNGDIKIKITDLSAFMDSNRFHFIS